MSLAEELKNSAKVQSSSLSLNTAGAGEALATDFSHVLDSPDEDEEQSVNVSALTTSVCNPSIKVIIS